jgi:FkbH-like protein
LTDEARRRGQLYLQRRSRQEEARAFGGSREDFLRYCGTRVTIAPAAVADLPRLHELSVRTHQFNSTGQTVGEAEFAGLLGSAGHQVVTVRLADRFGDDGMVGACVIVAASSAWRVPLLMMSCRALGRGVIDALLAWICRAASAAGQHEVAIDCVINPRNVPLRIALTGAGFRAAEPSGAGAGARTVASGAARTAVYRRAPGEPLPALPDWVTVPP